MEKIKNKIAFRSAEGVVISYCNFFTIFDPFEYPLADIGTDDIPDGVNAIIEGFDLLPHGTIEELKQAIISGKKLTVENDQIIVSD